MNSYFKRGFTLILACIIMAFAICGCNGGSQTKEEKIMSVVVALEGGSGRASITNPASVRQSEDGYVLTIEWSSSNYDYMIYEGEKYLPVNKEGNSTFELPVKSLEGSIDVIADTVAMSKPHEIEYKIVFDNIMYEPARGRAASGFDIKTMWIYPVIGLGFGLLIGRFMSRGRRARIAAEKAKKQESQTKSNKRATYTKKRKARKK